MRNNAEVLSLSIDSLNYILDKLKLLDKGNIELIEFKKSIEALKTNDLKSLIINCEDDYKTKNNDKDLDYKKININYSKRTIYIDKKEVRLTPKEFDILYVLSSNRGTIFSKEEIYKAVWKTDYVVDDSNIMAHIRRLRKKIEKDPMNPEYIITIWGVGYKFN
ncbi:winged helix-turn-helix domain-containing protein [Clostridium sp. LY3-2]|uniref:winged helix-turn-helix domain-containing protein n=1 Tax=Clostridium sp. LY3-2 TaxID=2942482 RepID=UPI0021529784|nr:winged helix-turn-helix domain-containing protein [Clostridium sp. LY3-2]MCR6516162.1 winged helix-turn-helix domain-containing protein [Clostridium sp. LY3-2]